ncbi:MAG: hypothetical protein K0S40_1215 [Actinomycetospora sp.]|nr:hypothetical protein [Actinomycetospora sp.]
MSAVGRALQVVAVGHAAVGVQQYRDVLADAARDVRERGPGAVVGAVGDRGDRATAFWFLLAAPALWTVGRTVTPGDRAAGGVLTALGVTGSVLVPTSGFPVVAALGAWAALGRPPATRRSHEEVTEHVGVADAPAAVRARSTLHDPAYLDHDVLATDPGPWTPEQVARVMFEDVGGARARAIWRTLMLRIDPRPSPDRVAGWRIDGAGDDWIRLHAETWWGRAQLIVHHGDGHLALTTVMAYDHPAAPAIWGAASAVHRRVVPGLLLATRRAIERRRV